MSGKLKYDDDPIPKKIDDSFSMHEKVANLFLISMFTLFPIVMSDKLFDVRNDRLHYFITTTIIFLCLVLSTHICFIDKEKWPKKIFKLDITDIGMLSFLVVCGISTLLSDYKKESFTGEAGRNSGLILMGVYFLCYFLISRYLRYKEFVFDIFIFTSTVVCIIAVMHEFYFDPFNIVNTISEDQRSIFITTIGNINIFSAFVCVALPVVTAMLVMSEDAVVSLLYCIGTGICFMGLIVANSDSGYFGLVAFMAVLFVFSCGSASRLFKYFLSIFVMLLSGKVLMLIAKLLKENMRALDTVPHALVFSSRMYIFIAVSGVLALAMFLVKTKYGSEHFPKAVQIAAGCLVGISALGLAAVFCYFSFIDTTTELGSLTKYLRLNDQWGTHRGYAWIRSVSLFKNGGIKNILVGTGPDTFGPVIKAIYREDMLKRHGSVFDNAHNEYLNYLVTVGALGLAAYLTALISLVVRCIRRASGSLKFLIVILVIVSYCSQAMFNLAVPIVTPYLFVFLGIGESYIRRFDAQEKNAAKAEK